MTKKDEVLKQNQKSINDLNIKCNNIQNVANKKFDQLLKEKNDIKTQAKRNEEKMLNYFMEKYMERIEKMEKDLNEKIEVFKDDMMSYI